MLKRAKQWISRTLIAIVLALVLGGVADIVGDWVNVSLTVEVHACDEPSTIGGGC